MKKGLCSSNYCMSLNLTRRDAARLICGFASGSVSRRCWFRAVWSDTLEIKQCISLPECQKVVFETTVCGRYMKSLLLCGKKQGTQTTANECLCIRSPSTASDPAVHKFTSLHLQFVDLNMTSKLTQYMQQLF